MSKLHWLARRLTTADGMTNLLVVDPKTGTDYLETEKKLEFLGFRLGDFVNVSQDGTREYTRSNTNNLLTREDKDFGYVDNVSCKLHKVDGMMVFTSGLFGSSLCSDNSLAEGSYHATIRWLESPVTVSNGTILYSVGTNALPNQKQQQLQKNTVPQQQPPNQSPKPFQAPSPAIRRFYQPPPSESSTNLPDIGFYLEDTEGSIAGESVESNEHRGRRSETFKFLWAARRSIDQGTTFLDCVGLKSGELFSFEEAKLNQDRIYLKMTFRFFPDSYRFLRKEHNSKPYMTLEYNLAYVHNVFSTLRTNGNHFIFSNALTAPALCREPLSPGRYSVRISLLETPVRLADGTEIVLEATMPRLEQRLQQCREFLALSRKNPRNDPSSRFPIRNNNQTETDVIPPKVDLRGSCMETLKALVLDRDGNCHKLWLPEKQVESTFFFHDQLKRRGCFQGEFEKLGNGNWECRRYQKRIDPFVITGFDSQNNIWLQVGITKYERQNGTRFPHAEAEHVGRIVDIDYKLSFDCKGKEVKVQRQKVWDDHSEWVAIEVLRASDAQ